MGNHFDEECFSASRMSVGKRVKQGQAMSVANMATVHSKGEVEQLRVESNRFFSWKALAELRCV